jgi:hypothetical protein
VAGAGLAQQRLTSSIRQYRSDARDAFVLANILPIHIAADELDPHPLVDVARRHQLSAYDAAYLAPAARQGLALTTHDSQLAARATTAGVQLLSGPPPPARQQASTVAASVTAASAAPPLGP